MKTKTKRFFVILFLLSLLLCSCSHRKDDRTKITYLTMETLPEQRRALAELVAEFESIYPDINVDVITSTTGFQKLMVQIAGGNSPDVFYYVTDRLPVLAYNGVVMDLTQLIKSDPDIKMNDYFSETVAGCKIEGKYYCFPFHYSTDVLFYNKDLFDAAGIDYPNDTWTWDDFLIASQKLTKRKGNKIVQYGTLLPRALLMIKSFGGHCFNKSLDRCIIDSQETRLALEWLMDLEDRYQVAPKAAAIKDMEKMDGIDMFSTGRIGMLLGRTFMLAEFRKLKNFDWNIAPVPRKQREYSRLAIGGNCIAADTEYLAESWEFVKFYSGKRGSLICGTSGNCVPALKEVADSEAFLKPPPEDSILFVTSIKDAESDNPGLMIWEEFYQRVLQENIDRILCGVISVDEGLGRIVKEGNELLAKEKEMRSVDL